MARDRRDLQDRQQQRDAVKQARIREQKRVRRKLILTVLILAACAAAVLLIARNNSLLMPKEEVAEETVDESLETQVTQPTEETSSRLNQPKKVIHIRAAGDLNVTREVVQSGVVGKKFDFTQSFIDVAPLLSEADWTVLNFEGNVCGEPYGDETRSAPPEILTALLNAGVDMVPIVT